MIFARETLTEFLLEGLPLLNAHYKEIAWRQDKIVLEPDFNRYLRIEEAGQLVVHTARTEEGLLKGYAIWLITPHLHYKSVLTAVNDIVYLAPEERGGIGGPFLTYAEAELKKLKVQLVSLHIKKMLDWSPLAPRLGFENVESTHLKWIGD